MRAADSSKGRIQRTHRLETDIRALQQPRRKDRLRCGQLVPPDLLPQDVGAFRDQQVWSEQAVSAQQQGLFCPWLPNYPFNSNAGINDKRGHRSSRPSRCNCSAGVWCRPAVSARSSAARSSNDGSASALNAWRRISRTSASAEWPRRAARRLSRAIKSSSRLRTLMLGMVGPALIDGVDSFWQKFEQVAGRNSGRTGEKCMSALR